MEKTKKNAKNTENQDIHAINEELKQLDKKTYGLGMLEPMLFFTGLFSGMGALKAVVMVVGGAAAGMAAPALLTAAVLGGVSYLCFNEAAKIDKREAEDITKRNDLRDRRQAIYNAQEMTKVMTPEPQMQPELLYDQNQRTDGKQWLQATQEQAVIQQQQGEGRY